MKRQHFPASPSSVLRSFNDWKSHDLIFAKQARSRMQAMVSSWKNSALRYASLNFEIIGDFSDENKCRNLFYHLLIFTCKSPTGRFTANSPPLEKFVVCTEHGAYMLRPSLC